MISKIKSNKSSFILTAVSTAVIIMSAASYSLIANAEDNVLRFDAEKQIEVEENQVAFVPFAGDNTLSNTVLSDLRTTGLKITTENLIGQPHSSVELTQTLPNWQQLGIPYLVVGRVQNSRGNTITEFEVIEVATGRIIRKQQTIVDRDSRTAAHKTAGRIYELITGNKSDFDARIVYIEEKGVGVNKSSSLIIRDADGANPRTITRVTNASIFSPAVSPDGRYIAYSVQLKDNYANLFKYDLLTKQITRLVDLKGSNLSPSFSPDGRSILFSSTVDGDADIYRVSSTGGTPQKIIDLPYDQVQPSYAPNGSFVFVSDHTSPRHPSIYRYTFSGSPTRVSRGGYAANPNYSPDGSKIGYLNGSSAAIMNSAGSTIINFGNTGLDEAPSFSPSNQHVVYAQGKNKSTIVIRPLGGGKTITLQADGVVRSPVWLPNQ